MKTTQAIITEAFTRFRPALAFSGGGDSMVLLDIVASMGYRPPLVYADSQMEYQGNEAYVRSVAERYGLELHVARAGRTPLEQWQRSGYPMLGKLAARLWMQAHREARDLGFRLDVSSCCRNMKIAPARRMIRSLGCDANLTGQRGGADDRLRGMRAHLDGAIQYVKSDRLHVVNPLLGWTDLMVRRYTESHALPVNPRKAAGALTIGCMYCGGGSQFDNSGFRVLRQTDPAAWRRMVIEYGFGPVILAIKYDVPLARVREALDRIGGLERVAAERPHVFDFTRHRPLRGYDR